jgi:hypothetical protein
MRLPILAALLCAAVAWADLPAPWEVRYAQMGDQTDEWTKMGRVPAWTLTYHDTDPPSFDVGGDKAGAFRGFVLIGRPWQVPEKVPAGLRISLRYQTYCAMDSVAAPRAGQAYLAVLTPEQWATFATRPQDAARWDVRSNTTRTITIHSSGNDVTEWADWQSPSLTGALRPLAGREVVLAIVWGCAHFNEEWAKFTLPQEQVMSAVTGSLDDIFDSLDLTRPGLEAVREAVEHKDFAAARAAFVAYMRARTAPVAPPTPPDRRAATAADEVLQHVYRLAGCPPYDLGPEIGWDEDPFNYDQWAIALNRHMEWVTLGRAYAATHDEKYAREFAAQVNSWVNAGPIYIGPRWIEGPYVEAGKSVLSLDAGIRMGQSWFPAYYYFKDSPSFDVDSQIRMIRSMRDHAQYFLDPATYHPASNWGAMEVNGLFHIAVMLPEFKDAPKWLQTAKDRLMECLKSQVYPDGAQIELSTGYHGVTLGNFVGALELARRTGTGLPSEFVSGFERMYEYYVAIAMPDGTTPALNDAGYGSVRGSLARGFELFPARTDFQYLATDGKAGTRPARTSWEMPYAGWDMMRSGWTAADRYLHFDRGPFGAGHQHEDKLSIIVHTGGKTIVPDAGHYSYDSSNWRRYVLSTRAHNTVMVDGQEQNCRRQRETYVVWDPKPSRWFSNDLFDFAEGEYAEGYGLDNGIKVTHTRQILFAKPDYWLVLDTMAPQDDKPHSYEALFHLDSEEATVDPGDKSVSVTYGDSSFRIVPLDPGKVEVSIIKGQTEPTVQGWMPTGQHNRLRAIPTAVFRWESTGPSTAGFALIPSDKGRATPFAGATPLANDAGLLAARITLADGRQAIVQRDPAPSGARANRPLETDADLAFVLLGADGTPVATFQSGGSRLGVR